MDKETQQIHERMDRMERKLDELARNRQDFGPQRSGAARFLIGFGIVVAVLFVLMVSIGVIQFVSSG